MLTLKTLPSHKPQRTQAGDEQWVIAAVRRSCRQLVEMANLGLAPKVNLGIDFLGLVWDYCTVLHCAVNRSWVRLAPITSQTISLYCTVLYCIAQESIVVSCSHATTIGNIPEFDVLIEVMLKLRDVGLSGKEQLQSFMLLRC